MKVTAKVPLPTRLAVRDHMLETFTKVARNRNKYSKEVPCVDDPSRTELEWIARERDVMCSAVNRMRSGRGLSPISLKDFMRIERRAVGSADYDTKLALYCAELALDEIDLT